MSQFHFDPATYLDLMRAEVPAYGRLQEAVAAASEGVAAVARARPRDRDGRDPGRRARSPRGAAAVGIDKNEAMLDAARTRLHGSAVELRVAELTDPLPGGPFDLVVSALAIHHLEGPDKAGAVRAGRRACCARVGASCSATW